MSEEKITEYTTQAYCANQAVSVHHKILFSLLTSNQFSSINTVGRCDRIEMVCLRLNDIDVKMVCIETIVEHQAIEMEETIGGIHIWNSERHSPSNR